MPSLKHQPPHRARPRAGSQNRARRLDPASQASCIVTSRRNCSNGQYPSQIKLQNLNRHYDSNQQYSITALTDGGGSIVERYAYTAYGQVTFANASGTVQTASASNNRYTYTGREWDAGLSLYHYRARMYDPVAGRFVSRDPIGYLDGLHLYRTYFLLHGTDPSGNESETPNKKGFCVNPKCGCKGNIEAKYELNNDPKSTQVGVNITLYFRPDDSDSCNCDKIGYIQMVEVKPGPWKQYLGGGKHGPFIDPWPSEYDPFYSLPHRVDPEWPGLIDRPRLHPGSDGSMTFESCAICKSSGRPDSIMGCVSWGFNFKKDDVNSGELIPMTSSTTPSAKFMTTLSNDHPEYKTEPCPQ